MTMVDQEYLDKFANADPNQTPGQGLVKPMGQVPDRVFGAQQVAVYRDEQRVRLKLSQLAAVAGADWMYSIPIRGGRPIEGGSIKLANDLARTYGNCDVDVRVADQGDSWVFYARFTDFETGYSLTRPFQQRKSQQAMRTDAARALDIAFQIGVSKAIRNVVLNALQTHADWAFEEAKRHAERRAKEKPEEERERVLKIIEHYKFDKARIARTIGRTEARWTPDDLAQIRVMLNTVINNMASFDDTFPPSAAEPTNGGNKTESGDTQ